MCVGGIITYVILSFLRHGLLPRDGWDRAYVRVQRTPIHAHQQPWNDFSGPVVLCSAYGVVDQIGERCTQHRTGMRVSRAGSSSSRAGGRKRKRDRACSHYYRTSSLIYPRVGSMLDRADLLSPVWNLNLFKFRSCSELDASSLCGAELPDTIPDYSPRSQHTRNGVEAARSPQMD